MELQELKNQLLKLSKEDSANLLLSLKDEINEKNEIIVKQKTELETWDRITNDDEWFKMSEVAKLLNSRDKKYKAYGRNTIFAILRDCGILNRSNEPYQAYVDNGNYKIIITDKAIGAVKVPVVSGKGIDQIRRILDEHITSEL